MSPGAIDTKSKESTMIKSASGIFNNKNIKIMAEKSEVDRHSVGNVSPYG
jgi:hypothetical protein